MDVWPPIQEIRRVRDRHFNRWMPHVNLIYPFYPESEFNNLETLVSNLCKEIEEFEVNLSRFKFFKHRNNNFTVWLEPEPISLIKELQSKLINLIPDCDDLNKHEGGFTPHLSVGQVVGKQELKAVLHLLDRDWNPLKFVLKEIYFISREIQKNSRFSVKRAIGLKKSL